MRYKRLFLTLLSRLSLIGFGVLLSLILAEILFRLLYPDPSPKLVNQALQLHDTYGISFTPNAEGWNTSLRGEYSAYIKINSRGLRGQEYDYHKEAGVFRILMLGDSFTAALQVDEAETFSALLARHLNEESAYEEVEVINAGVVGYGTANQRLYFLDEGYKYQPDLVILAFFAGNDISDNINPPHYKLENGALVPIPARYGADIGTPPWAQEGSFFRNVRNSLYTHSRLYSVTIELLAFSIIKRFPSLTHLLASTGLVEATRPVMNAGNIYAFLRPSAEAWAMTEALLLALTNDVAAHNSQLLVVILPDETEVDPQKWATIFESYPDLFSAQPADRPTPTGQLSQFLQDHDIPHLSLLPALKAHQAQTNQSLYYRLDGHWKPAGHQVAAETIYRYLRQHADQITKGP